MYTLDEFKLKMKAIEDFNKEHDEVNEGIKLICPGTHAMTEIGCRLLDSYVELLEEVMEDTDSDYSWISWFVYDCNMGKDPLEYTIDGIIDEMDSVEKLYKVLTNKGE